MAQPISARERIEATRARLRSAMLPPPAAPKREPRTGLHAQLERLKELPGIAVIVDTLQSWWQQTPLRPLAEIASRATSAMARPVAQQNPVALVVVAGLFGAVFVWSRPWRWALKSALLAGLMPQLAARLFAHLPLESWLASLGPTPHVARPPTSPPRTSP